MVIGDLVGRELVSDWRTIAQTRVDAFADATDDPQWIHVDPERAARGPFGTTIAHGFLTLSLVVTLFEEALPALEGYSLTVNYGLNRVRFPAPVPVGTRIRGHFRVADVETVAGGVQATVAATMTDNLHIDPAHLEKAFSILTRGGKAGSVEVRAIGILKTADGRGTFALQSATLGGVPIPKTVLQELVSSPRPLT